MPAPTLLGVSLKMYFGHHETLNWARRIGDIASRHPAVTGGLTEVFVLPAFPGIVPLHSIFAGTGVAVGAQDLAVDDHGPFTGEVSGRYLKEIGCAYAEVGHAERRRLFGEGDTTVAAKTAAALRNGLTPVLCVGELDPAGPDEAADRTVAELERIMDTASHRAAAAAVSSWPMSHSGRSGRRGPPPPNTSPPSARPSPAGWTHVPSTPRAASSTAAARAPACSAHSATPPTACSSAASPTTRRRSS